jgi:hypothetical protein
MSAAALLWLWCCRHGLVPPPMCAVRALLPRPAVALAWLDGDTAADLDDQEGQQQQQPQDKAADLVAMGMCEVLAVALSDGSLVFLRAAESDLWEEALEDQQAAGGPSDFLLPLGCSSCAGDGRWPSGGPGPAGAAHIASSACSISGNGWTSTPRGPWSAAVTTDAGGGGAAQRPKLPAPCQRLPDVSPAPVQLPEGSVVQSLVWLRSDRLLLLLVPPMQPAGESRGEDQSLLLELELSWEQSCQTSQVHDDSGVHSHTHESAICAPPSAHVLHSGATTTGRVLTAAPLPAAVAAAAGGFQSGGGALLQLHNGRLLRYEPGGQLVPLPPNAYFPVPCPCMRVLPAGSAVAGAAPAVGVARGGGLFWGTQLVAQDATSVALRGGGPGGAALLYTTQQSLLFVVMVSRLHAYVHTPVCRDLRRIGS